nr:cytochrome P450 family 72 subfamily A polypeptide 7 [Ipomoea batatas]
MDRIQFWVSILFLFVSVAAVVIWACRVVQWVWLKPRKLEKWLRQQGLNGSSYRIFYGDTKEMATLSAKAKSKPINLSDDILPRVLPFYHLAVTKYGKNCFVWSGPAPRVIISEPELMQEVFMNNTIFKRPKPHPLVKFLVSGLGRYEDQQWARHRKIISPAFYPDKIKCMVPSVTSSCEEMIIKKWELITSEKNWCDFDVQPYLDRFTSDVISRTAFGCSYIEGNKIFSLQTEQAELTRQVLHSVYSPDWWLLSSKRSRRMHEIDNEIRGMMKGLIGKRERGMKEKVGDDDDDEDLDLLGVLLKSGFSTDEVIEECQHFYFAGQESGSDFLVWIMILLSIHQTWQDRARQEVRQVFGNNKPDFDGLNRLKILTMILNEVLRLYPPSPYTIRTMYEETRLGEMKLPPNIILVLSSLLVQRDPDVWGADAGEFKPERFAEGVAKATKNRLAFLPFGWGPRTCIGNNFAMMEAKIAIATILQRFSFQLSPSYAHSPCFVVTLKPQFGAPLVLHKI